VTDAASPPSQAPDAEAAVTATATGDERSALEAFLEYYRDTVKRKVAGLSDEQARRRLVPSMTTLGGLIKHLRWVEMNWFQRVLASVPATELPPVPWNDDDPDADFRVGEDETLAGLIEQYDAQCALSRSVAATRDLEDAGAHAELGAVSLRWIYLHMIEETSRHAGHADILRELVDGTVGE
jgi:hypothetical protein